MMDESAYLRVLAQALPDRGLVKLGPGPPTTIVYVDLSKADLVLMMGLPGVSET